MKRVSIYLIFPLILSFHSSWAQNLDSAPSNQDTLGNSGFGIDESGGLSFSVGGLYSELVIGHPSVIPSNTQAETIGKDSGEIADITVIPNPFVDRISLHIEGFINHSGKNYHFELFDISGNAVHLGQMKTDEEEIVLHSEPMGVYFLILYENDRELKSFKLLKNDL